MLCAFTMAGGSIRASRLLFINFFSAVVHAPMLFFYSTPYGRILNRVSEDVSNIDRVMPFTVRAMFNCILGGLASIFVIAFATPWFLISLPALAIVYYYIQVNCSHQVAVCTCRSATHGCGLFEFQSSCGNCRAFACLSGCFSAGLRHAACL